LADIKSESLLEKVSLMEKSKSETNEDLKAEGYFETLKKNLNESIQNEQMIAPLIEKNKENFKPSESGYRILIAFIGLILAVSLLKLV